jgi:hypothetical protein
MDHVIICLVIGLALERAQMIISAPNYSSLYNGFGVIDLVNERRAKAPMAYRVLVPWLIQLAEALGVKVNNRIVVYETLKVILNSLAIWSVWTAWGMPVALVTAILLLLTFAYDYWDWAPELTGIALAMTGRWELAIVGVILAGFSRETALLSPAAFFLKTGNPYVSIALSILCVSVLAFIRVYVGKRDLYCDRFQWRYNLGLFKDFFRWKPFFLSPIFCSTVITALILAGTAFMPTGWPIPLIVLAAGWVLAKADETRIFTSCLPWVAVVLLRMV